MVAFYLNYWRILANVLFLYQRITRRTGFKFVGSVTIYAYLQAVGVINDHLTDCFRYKEILNSYEDIFDGQNKI
jgi:hypothetical protein